jgi:hypothetical protein
MMARNDPGPLPVVVMMMMMMMMMMMPACGGQAACGAPLLPRHREARQAKGTILDAALVCSTKSFGVHHTSCTAFVCSTKSFAVHHLVYSMHDAQPLYAAPSHLACSISGEGQYANPLLMNLPDRATLSIDDHRSMVGPMPGEPSSKMAILCPRYRLRWSYP